MADDPGPDGDAPAPFVPPGTGWPGDPADADTPVAATRAEVDELASGASTLPELIARQSVCRACPRLVEWREEVALTRRKSFRSERYWGRPVPGWGDPEPSILIVGLAPAAHGGNRTGRVFTGDRSGDFIFASLYRCGLATSPVSVSAGDGLRLIGARMAAVVRCAPPENKPTPQERDTCIPWLTAELHLVSPSLRVIVCLGGFAWQALWPVLGEAGYAVPRPRPAFGHGVETVLHGNDRADLLVLGCYHPSQQNTFTGRVTPAMFDAIFSRANDFAGRVVLLCDCGPERRYCARCGGLPISSLHVGGFGYKTVGPGRPDSARRRRDLRWQRCQRARVPADEHAR